MSQPLRFVKRDLVVAFVPIGFERAGKCAAAIQSLPYTAKLNGLDPASWLRETLEKLPTCPNSQIDSLLQLRSPAVHA